MNENEIEEHRFSNEVTVRLNNQNDNEVFTIVWQGNNIPSWVNEQYSDETTLVYLFKEKLPNFFQTNGFTIKPNYYN